MDKPKSEKTVKLFARTRVFYLDIRRDAKGQRYTTITEAPCGSKKGNAKKSRIYIYEEDMAAFLAAVGKVAEHLYTNKS